MVRATHAPLLVATALLVGALAGCVQEPDGEGVARVSFEEIAQDPGSGLSYERTPSDTQAVWEQVKRSDPITIRERTNFPMKHGGAPGVALLDHDDDGDQDLFVPNGPGTPHSLFENRLEETGELTFEDVAGEVGVAAGAQDGTGVCFGDTDNDGDEDLLVLSRMDRPRYFVNRLAETGRATFADRSDRAGFAPGRGAAACSWGDVDGDGRLDLVVANTYSNWEVFFPVVDIPTTELASNDLYLNAGDHRFRDVSNASGFRNLSRLPEGAGTITWAIAMVDVDLDGDLDLVQADDQGVIPGADKGGVDRGLVRILDNDGTGNFTDVTYEVGTDHTGGWMGLAFGDLDRDGTLDLFGTRLGDYVPPFPSRPESYERGAESSAWLLGQGDGTFGYPGVGELEATPFGWGASMLDYDNDADTDIIFHGGMAMIWVGVADNPGALLENDGSAHLTYDADALDGDTNHSRRVVEGVATGDLNGDGFPDIVSASGFDFPDDARYKRFPFTYGGPFEETAYFTQTLAVTDDRRFVWDGFEFDRGSLSVEINSGGNGNRWIAVETRGSIGLTPNGSVNRDGIGAVVTVDPAGQPPQMRPVVGGSSYASQDALRRTFGLAGAGTARVEVLWPGGVRNVLHNVSAGQEVLFPEIPCDVDGSRSSGTGYERCVSRALSDLVAEGVLDEEEADRFRASARRAFAG